MKSVILVALALVAITLAAPAEKEPTKIVRADFDQKPEGGYHYLFETDDGTVRHEDGTLTEVLDEEGKPRTVVVVRGSYTYTNTDGYPETISYTADENGFHAEGDSIPKAPVARR